jgi:thiol-disulfide isomerase/thioredoxin
MEVWMGSSSNDPKETAKQIDEFIAKSKNPKNVNQAKYVRTILALRGQGDDATKLNAINQFLTDVPEMKTQGASLLFSYAQRLHGKDADAIYDRILEQYGDTPAAANVVGAKKLASAEGKPFDLEFTDATSGEKISTKDLKGKVIVVDFWATWCGPCVGEMPHMKQLYGEYKDKGVQFIGVSLDQPESAGGLKALKEFVAKNEIGWPQYYQGKGWESEFSKSWGIMSIPHVFLIDKQGKVVTTEGRGQLETLLPKLLEQKID